MELEEIKRQVLEDVDPELKKQKRKQTIKGYLAATIQFVAVIAAIIIIFCMMMGFATVEGTSMYPTLHDSDIIIYRKNIEEYKAGDIVVLERDNGSILVKRIVALPGDTVNIQGGEIYVNGIEYVVEGLEAETTRMDKQIENPYIVKTGEVFVLGDNRENSEDSRSFGSVPVEKIRGRLQWYIGK